MVQVKDPTDIQSSYKDLGNPATTTPSELDAAEKKSSGDYAENSSDPYTTAGIDQLEALANDAWSVNRTPGGGKGGAEPLSKKALRIFKKSAPITAITGLLVGLGIGASMFFSPAMLLVHIKEVITSRFNIQSTALDMRTNKIIAKKLTSVATTGCSDLLQKCKYSRMSNNMLKKLDAAGFTAVDKNGAALVIKDGYGSARPYGFTNPNVVSYEKVNGNFVMKDSQILTAKDFAGLVRDNPEVATTFRKVFNPTWSAFWDSTYMDKFLGRYGLGKASKVSGDTEEDVKTSFDDQVDGTAKERVTIGALDKNGQTKDAAQASQTAASEADALVQKAGTQTTEELAQSLSKEVGGGGKVSGGAMLIANLYCMAASTGKIAKAVRVIQMGQIIAYGMLFFQAADEIKSGNGSVAKAAFYGTALTTVLVDTASHAVKKRAATDSVSMKYSLLKDSGASSTTSDYTKYLPGGGIVSMLQQFSNAVSGKGDVKKALDNFCAAVNSDAGQAASLLLDFTPVGLAMTAIGYVVGQFSGVLLAPMLGMLAGKIVDSSLQAEDLGNAAATGMVQTVAEGSNAGAMMPMSPTQTSAYLKLNAETQLANARMDQATLSPFDTSSPNTFLGSIMTQMLPYYGSMQSVTGVFGSIAKLVGSSFSSIVSPTTSALNDSDIGGCPDKTIAEEGVAVGKLCNVWYAIPVEYLGLDPEENQTILEAAKQINSDGTLVAGSDAEKYLTECSPGDGSAATADCVIDSENKARYALASVDRRLQRNMDGEDTVASAPATSAAPTGSCPTGTDLVSGLTAGWNKDTGEQTSITLCSIPNTDAQINPGWTNKKYQGTSSKNITDITVNAEAAQGLLDAANQYTKETGHQLSASVAYRSVFEQCSFFVGGKNTYGSDQAGYYNKYCTPNKSWLQYPTGNWTTDRVVSNHMMGISIDFTAESEKWMRGCMKSATDSNGKKTNRCHGFYDDVLQSGHGDSAHFTFSPV